MKHISFFLLLLLVLSLQTTAQHWAPVRMGERYNYQQAPADVITQTLWADSLKVVNGDSVWYMNRTFSYCDSCSSTWEIYFIPSPFFMGEKVRKIADGHYQLIYQDSLDIQAFRQKNESWIFSKKDSITATVDSVWAAFLFGQISDSVKSISLSSGGAFSISKNHGILSWAMPDEGAYRLLGLQGATIAGEQVPMYEDFYGEGYAVGDVIEGAGTGYYYSSMGLITSIGINRYKITRLDSLTHDTIVYQCLSKGIGLSMPGGGGQVLACDAYSFVDWMECSNSCSPRQATLKIKKFNADPSHPANAWPGQFVLSNKDINDFNPSSTISPVFLVKTKDGRMAKMIGSDYGLCLSDPDFRADSILLWMEHHKLREANLDPGNTPNTPFRASSEGYNRIYYPDTGLRSWYGFIFEYVESYALLGHIHNGDTTGSILPESYWWPTGLQPEENGPAFSIFPNPARKRFSVRLQASGEARQFHLRSLTGQRLLTWQVAPGQQEVSLELQMHFAEGLYLLELEADGLRSSSLLRVLQ
ncbi:MAG: hypothetical protein R3B47_04300 [Bacteroidia bacterium]